MRLMEQVPAAINGTAPISRSAYVNGFKLDYLYWGGDPMHHTSAVPRWLDNQDSRRNVVRVYTLGGRFRRSYLGLTQEMAYRG
jgi:hypothetical protein